MRTKEWLNEKDCYEFEYKGYKCEIKRIPSLGHLCGYVYTDLFKDLEYDVVPIICHGGITFNGVTNTGNWAIGFDCAHMMDYVPYVEEIRIHVGKYSFKQYRNVEYVTKELHKVVDQIIKFKEANK